MIYEYYGPMEQHRAVLLSTWAYAVQPEDLGGLSLPIAYGGEHVPPPSYLTGAEEAEDFKLFLARMEERCWWCHRYRGLQGHCRACGMLGQV